MRPHPQKSFLEQHPPMRLGKIPRPRKLKSFLQKFLENLKVFCDVENLKVF
jgi:hypothetical protein